MKNSYLIIGLISVLIVGIGIYFLIVENGSNDVVQTTVEQGSFDVKLKEDEIKVFLNEKNQANFILTSKDGFDSNVKFITKTPLMGIKVSFDNPEYHVSAGAETKATIFFEPINEIAVGQHNVTLMIKSQKITKDVNLILDVIGEGEIQIIIENYNFDPQIITVVQGTKIVWYNKDDVIHTVTSIIDVFDLDMERREYESVTFNDIGTFTYLCSPHPYMTGIINVIPRR